MVIWLTTRTHAPCQYLVHRSLCLEQPDNNRDEIELSQTYAGALIGFKTFSVTVSVLLWIWSVSMSFMVAPNAFFICPWFYKVCETSYTQMILYTCIVSNTVHLHCIVTLLSILCVNGKLVFFFVFTSFVTCETFFMVLVSTFVCNTLFCPSGYKHLWYKVYVEMILYLLLL